MKNGITFLLIILAFAGCKDDEQPELVVKEEVNEIWKKLPDSTLYIGTSGVLALEERGGIVHINTERSYYSLDTALNKLGNKSMISGGSWYQLWAPKYGKEYALHGIDGKTIRVMDNTQPTSWEVTLVTNTIASDEILYTHTSSITDKQEFSTITLIRKQDSLFYVLQNWEIDHSPGSQSRIIIVEKNKIIVKSLEARGQPPGDIKVYRYDDRILVNIQQTVWVYEKNEMLSTYRSNFENMIMVDGTLYAGGDNAGSLPDSSGFRMEGLMTSSNRGLTWQFISEDSELRRLNFKLIDGQFFAFGQPGLGKINADFSAIEPMDFEGLPSQARILEKVGSYAFVGTSQGIYYKSWESFLNK
jgi:hypothetical protein